MQRTVDDAAEHCCPAQVAVQPGLGYRCKPKAGDSDDWFLDEHGGIGRPSRLEPGSAFADWCPEADHQGNKASWLRMPVAGRPADRPPQTGSNRAPVAGLRQTAEGASDATTSGVVQPMSAPVPDEVRREQPRPPAMPALVEPTPSRPDVSQEGGDVADSDDDDLEAPLLAHETLWASGTTEEGSDHEDLAVDSASYKLPFAEFSWGRLDADDPTVEKFPSERSSILDTLRRIQSSHDEYRRAPLRGDSPDGSCAPASPSSASTGRRESRPSTGSPEPARSAVSLWSIAEEPTGVAAQPTRLRDKTPPTDEDEVLMMRPSKA